MSHELANEREMFYVGETPWHGLGIELPRLATAAEAKAACFDYRVNQEPINTISGIRVQGYLANVRSDTQEVVGVVSPQYKVVQPEDCFKFFDAVTLDPSGPKYETGGNLFGGRKIWLLARLPDMIRIDDKDNIEQYILLVNSFDGSTPLMLLWTMVRVVCNNTFTLALNKNAGKRYKVRHYPKPTDVRKAQEFLGIIAEDNLSMKQIADDLLNFTPTEKQVAEYLTGLFPGAISVEIPGKDYKSPVLHARKLIYEQNDLEFADRQTTGWGIYNAVTQTVDHFTGFRSQENRFDSVLLGQKAALKERAMNDALAWLN